MCSEVNGFVFVRRQPLPVRFGVVASGGGVEVPLKDGAEHQAFEAGQGVEHALVSTLRLGAVLVVLFSDCILARHSCIQIIEVNFPFLWSEYAMNWYQRFYKVIGNYGFQVDEVGSIRIVVEVDYL